MPQNNEQRTTAIEKEMENFQLAQISSMGFWDNEEDEVWNDA